MCYVQSTKSQKLIGWVGNDLKSLSGGIYADADYAGCGQSLRSTSGSHMMAFGSHTRFPLAGGSKRQGCVSHSTPKLRSSQQITHFALMPFPSSVYGKHWLGAILKSYPKWAESYHASLRKDTRYQHSMDA